MLYKIDHVHLVLPWESNIWPLKMWSEIVMHIIGWLKFFVDVTCYFIWSISIFLHKKLWWNYHRFNLLNFPQELSAGHIAHLTDCFQAVTDEIGELSETDFATLDKLFELGFHLMIPFIISFLVQCNEPCYHNYVAVISWFFFWPSIVIIIIVHW